MGDFIGKAKMFYTEKGQWKGTKMASFDHLYGIGKHILWHLILRTFYAYEYSDLANRKSLYSKAIEAVHHNMTKGGLSSETAGKMMTWVYNKMRGVGEPKRYGAKKGKFEGMHASLGPPDPNSWGNRRRNVYEYLKALWKWKKETTGIPGSEEDSIYGEFPLMDGISGELGLLKPKIAVSQRTNPQPHITHFQNMMQKKVPLDLPVTRNGLDTKSSSSDKK